MTTIHQRIETSHRDAIHDAQLNMYGSRLATCGSDRLVKIFEVRPNGQSYPIAELAGHAGPVWKVSWAHPKFGGLLASAAYDKKVMIWQEVSGRWQKAYEWNAHEASTTCVAFAPLQYGLMLASSSADGDIGILRFDAASSQWLSSKIPKTHEQGVNAISWAPASLATDAKMRLVSAGCDKNVKIWVFDDHKNEWTCEKVLHGHTDFVRDVAWCPVTNNGLHSIVSCGADGNLVLYRSKNIENADDWQSKLLERDNSSLFHVSWSPCGAFLSVSGDNNTISIWRENLQGQWMKVPRDNNHES